jgi:hypothetical protein
MMTSPASGMTRGSLFGVIVDYEYSVIDRITETAESILSGSATVTGDSISFTIAERSYDSTVYQGSSDASTF